MSYIANLDQVCIASTQSSSFKMAYPNVEHYDTTANCQSDALSSTTTIPTTASDCTATLFDPLDAGVTRYPAEPFTKSMYEDKHVVADTTAVTARRLRGN